MILNDVKTEKFLFNGKFIMGYHVFIKKEEYEFCVDAANNMWCSKNESYLNTPSDPRKTERIGRLGEMAFGKIIGQSIDAEYKEYGDTMDFLYKKYKINVKCAAKYPLYECGLIRMKDGDGNKIKLKQDIYVFSYLKNENRNLRQANVTIIGYREVDFILKLSEKKAKKGNHYNYEVPYSDLIDISNMTDQKPQIA